MKHEYLIKLTNGKIVSAFKYANTLDEAIEYADRARLDWTFIENKITGEFQEN